MDLMKLIKGTDIGDCVARLLFTWNADHPDAEKAKETFISAIKARMPQQARLNLSSAEKLSDSIDRYLIKNDTEMYAAVKIGSAMMLAALANRETENAALVRSAAESFISDIPDGIADDREALSEIIFSEKEGREKLIEIFTDPGDVVIDPCAGSGSTLRAARELGRDSYGFEICKEFYRDAVEKMLKVPEAVQIGLEGVV